MSGRETRAAGELVVQKHRATALHYDFSLENRGAMLSRTITKVRLEDLHIGNVPSRGHFWAPLAREEAGALPIRVVTRESAEVG